MSDEGIEAEATTPLTDAGVLAANDCFYEAIETGDIDQMGWLWGHGPDLSCAHPGRPTITGRRAVMASWQSILAGGVGAHVIATDVVLARRGSLAWVTANENMLSAEGAGIAAAFNLFEHDGERWRLIVHHSAPVYAGP